MMRDGADSQNHSILFGLLRHGRIYEGGGHWTLAHRRWLAGQSFEHPRGLDEHAAGVCAATLADPPMVGRCGTGLPDPRIEAETADQVAWTGKPADVADRGHDTDRDRHGDAGDRHQPAHVRVVQSDLGGLPINASQILSQTVQLAQMALDRCLLIGRQRLVGQPSPPLVPKGISRRARWDQMRVQDGMDRVLQAGPLAHDLGASCDTDGV